MVLHTLNASPSSAAFDDCLCLLGPGDAILLIGDGVYAAIEGTPACAALEATGAGIHVLLAHATAAGVNPLARCAVGVDMDGFVALTERFPRQQAWY